MATTTIEHVPLRVDLQIDSLRNGDFRATLSLPEINLVVVAKGYDLCEAVGYAAERCSEGLYLRGYPVEAAEILDVLRVVEEYDPGLTPPSCVRHFRPEDQT
jgi:hypothetical protein